MNSARDLWAAHWRYARKRVKTVADPKAWAAAQNDGRIRFVSPQAQWFSVCAAACVVSR